jgi:mRNA-degrading endonuclease RelE of RelBE toxin-antitoxin system
VSYRIDSKPWFKRDLKAIPRREALTIFEAISSLSHNNFLLQSMTLNGGEVWRLRVGRCRVIWTVSPGEITLFVEKAGHHKKSTNDFLQNEANISAVREMHDKASYQLLSLAEVAVGFAVGFSLPLM